MWRSRGIEQPFQARMGINTGYCNVGNFGSDDRMDYTIFGGQLPLCGSSQKAGQSPWPEGTWAEISK